MSTTKLAITLTLHALVTFACVLMCAAHMPLLGLTVSLCCTGLLARTK